MSDDKRIYHAITFDIREDGKTKVACARSGEGWGLYWCPVLANGEVDEEYEPDDDDFIAWPFGADETATADDMRRAGFTVLR